MKQKKVPDKCLRVRPSLQDYCEEEALLISSIMMVARFVFLVALGVAVADLDAPERRLSHENDYICPPEFEEKLYYNMNITIESVGEGCEEYDLFLNAGDMLQEIVDEIEEQIPENEYETMETTVCPIPIIELARRSLRFTTSNRLLASRKKGRYTYKAGGRCRRCRKKNNDRRILQDQLSVIIDTCQMANKAANSANLAMMAAKRANTALSDLKATALECSDLRSGKTLVAWAKKRLRKCNRTKKKALNAAKRVTSICQQAKLASSDTRLQSLVPKSRKATNNAKDAANKAHRRYIEMSDKIASTDVCNLPIETPTVSFNAEGASAKAAMAAFGVELAGTAVKKAKEVFSRLKDNATECKDSTTGAESLARAKALFRAAQKSKRQAKKKAKLSRAQSLAAQAPAYTNKLRDSANMAGQFSNDALLAAENARDSYFLLREELKRPICGATERSAPDGTGTVQSPTVTDTMTTASTALPTAATTRARTNSLTASPSSLPDASSTAAEYKELDHNEVEGFLMEESESEIPLKIRKWPKSCKIDS